MKNSFYLLFILFGFSSCQFFETEKIPSAVFYEEEKRTIDWHDVDQYPLFSDCEEVTTKEIQKTCFEGMLASRMFQSINDPSLMAVQNYVDTLYLTMQISKEGKMSIKELKMDSITKKDFPKLEELVLNAIDSIQLVAPAYKRGIPVKTQFTLPVVLQTQ